jgi:hypothetical protein
MEIDLTQDEALLISTLCMVHLSTTPVTDGMYPVVMKLYKRVNEAIKADVRRAIAEEEVELRGLEEELGRDESL